MSFLQPWMLIALPFAALPILIHLINQRRYQTTDWAAMRFLLAANRMTRGYAKIRQWAILAMRTIAIAALVFAIGRPLASGSLGGGLFSSITGGSASTIVLVDRSPSMQQQVGGASLSKLEMGVGQLTETLTTLGTERLVLFDSVELTPRELTSPAELLQLPQTGPSDASADLPAMLMAAQDYIAANKLGQTEIWIVSDLRAHDWNPGDARWTSLRDSFVEYADLVRFRLLEFPHVDSDNHSVRVSDVRLDSQENASRVAMTIDISGSDVTNRDDKIPVTIELDGSRTVVDVDANGSLSQLKDHQIELPRGTERGWGKVSIPADTLAADNVFYFTYDKPAPRRTVIVTEHDEFARVLSLAAEISSEENVPSMAEVVAPASVSTVLWHDVSLVLWQGDVPVDQAAKLQAFVERGGSVIFFPAPTFELTTESEPIPFPGDVCFGQWNEPSSPISVSTWRGEADLLAATLNGGSLPVGQLQVHRYASIEGDATPLATLDNREPLIVRIPTPRGGVYACATTPCAADSSLAADGVVLYVMIQRALAVGARSLRGANVRIAGESTDESLLGSAMQLDGPEDRLSTEKNSTAGVYQTDDRWWAVNRDQNEDGNSVVDDAKLAELFNGLQMERLNQGGQSTSSLVEEVWRAFLIATLIALIIEAVLCLPRQVAANGPRSSVPVSGQVASGQVASGQVASGQVASGQVAT
ncbi:hypothetical protein Q31b_22730 [Novipirellula aureliae]|uniref:Aerotolerance regulator N-terminal domain-containing protein n=1 Tax=Novipirellula aureliae TaxID=2527966 RepID=A0A5C6E3G7_9BACT|nr:BatA domain-containing protein [Novipirellula aureliae]TWU43235.1 hypothetical protein Q31b_22730 [Novipirellula aureliae]